MTEGTLGIAARVRSLRLAAGLSQAELAEAAGISERGVSDLERGLRTRVYPATARRLATALGLGDGEVTAFLVAASGGSRSRLSGPEPFPSDVRSRLPVVAGALLGRDDEHARVVAALSDPVVRMITICGPAGVGKTRLAIAAADAAAAIFGDARHFVNLSSIDSATGVLPAIAAAVGAAHGDDVPGGLTAHLRRGPALIVLDSMEHVLDAAPRVAEIAAACPDLRVISTSRSPLNVIGEWVLQLSPLAVDTGGDEPSPAVQLFLERARTAAPELSLNREGLDIAASICRRVDGLPLAIELAAARVRTMPLAELFESFGEPLALLTGGPRDQPSRHHSMRAAVDWSYQLLDPAARHQLRALSAFHGGFDVDAAAWVAGPGWSDHRTRVVNALSQLVDASLVTLEPDVAGRGRFRMLDVVREYAREQAVELGDTAAIRRRHAGFYLRLAEEAEPHLRGAQQREWHARLLADEANLRAAMTWALEHGDADAALEMAASLWMFWRWAGLFAEGRVWLDAALARDGGSRQRRLRALWGAGWLAYHQADYARTAASGDEILASAPAGDAVNRRNGLTLIGIAQLAAGQLDRAVATSRDALSLVESSGAPWLEATSLLNLGTALLAAGDVAAARAQHWRALQLYGDIGDRHFSARVRIQLGYCAMAEGQQGDAARLITEALELTADLGDLWGIAECLEAAGALAAVAQPQPAAMLAGGADRVRQRIAMRPHPADARINERRMEAAREALGDPVYDAAWNRGAHLTVEELQDLARTAAASTDA